MQPSPPGMLAVMQDRPSWSTLIKEPLTKEFLQSFFFDLQPFTLCKFLLGVKVN